MLRIVALDEIVVRRPAKDANDNIRPEIVQERIEKMLSDKEFMAAIYYANPIFYSQIIKITNASELPAKIFKTLTNYYNRMCYRPTPFGLFAGQAVGKIDDGLHPKDEDLGASVPVISLSYHGYMSVAFEIHRKYITREPFEYTINMSLYRNGDRWYYYDNSIGSDREDCKLSSILDNEIIQQLVGGNKLIFSIQDAAEILNAEYKGCSIKRITSYLYELASCGVLIPKMYPTVHDNVDIRNIMTVVKNLDKVDSCNIEALADIIDNVQSDYLSAMACRPLEEAYHILKKYNRNVRMSNIVSVNMYYSGGRLAMPLTVVEEVGDALGNIGEMERTVNSNFEMFKHQFRAQYGQRTVRLVEALDPIIGIPYPNEDYYSNRMLGRDMRAVLSIEEPGYTNGTSTRFEAELDEEYVSVLKSGKNVVFLDKLSHAAPSTLVNNDCESGLKCDTVAAVVRLYRDPDDEEKCVPYLEFVVGGTAMKLISRFCLQNSNLDSLAKKIADIESSEDAVSIELSHIPNAVVYNVMNRPMNREVGLAMHQDSFRWRALPISEMRVRIDGDLFILCSGKTDEKYKVFSSTMHNYEISPLPVYRFICDMQEDRSPIRNITWARRHISKSYVPRIMYKNVVVSRARWRILWNNKYLERPLDVFEDHELPQKVVLVENDRELEYDKCQKLDCTQLVEMLKRRKVLIVEESLAGNDEVNGGGYDGRKQYIIFYKVCK